MRNQRAIGIINRCIQMLSLNLDGATVLTEVGSNNYMYTPVIPLLSNAKKVIVWAKDTRYGTAESIIEQFKDLLSIIDVAYLDKVVIRENIRPDEDIKEADIITNSGIIRPIDESFIQKLKPTCVIPVMYEAWELRDSDINIQACKFKGIKVAGTWENHPALSVFDYGGMLAIKFSQEAGFEVFGNKIIVWSDDHFGEVAVHAFEQVGARQVIQTTDIEVLMANISDTEFVYICDYDEQRQYIGIDSFWPLQEMLKVNPILGFIHLYGRVSIEYATDANVLVYPKKEGYPMIMTETLGYVGLEPILRLQVGGFKVAEELKSGRYSSLTQLI
jgi:hypothetical protein